MACPPTFSVDFTIPTEGPDNYDKTLLVDITDSYRTIKVTIFRPAPNMTAEAYGKWCFTVIAIFMHKLLSFLWQIIRQQLSSLMTLEISVFSRVHYNS